VEIHFNFVRRFGKKYPNWPHWRVIREVEKYVASWKGRIVSGHMAGGAIDLRLVDKYGRKIPMKSRKLTYQENAMPVQKKLPSYIQKNRQILFEAMQRAGFSNCHNEYWHWSYGDYYWAIRTKNPVAIYGPARDRCDLLYKDKSCLCGAKKSDGTLIKYKKCCSR
jgi:D-alanyl-D-alanine dipeptidase